MKCLFANNILTLFVILAILLAGCGTNKKEETQHKSTSSPKTSTVEEVDIATLPPVDSIPFSGLVNNLDSLIHFYIQAFEDKDVSFIQKHTVSFLEHKALYYHTPGADLNPRSAGFIAGLFKASNNKHLGRWLDAFEARGYKYSRHTIGPVKKEGQGFQILSDCKLWVTNENGQEEEIKLFRSILKVTTAQDSLRGYKIWSILDD
jgi:hypothetical protein